MSIIFRSEIKSAKDPAAKNAELVEDYKEKFQNPYKAAELGYIDEVILPDPAWPHYEACLRMAGATPVDLEGTNAFVRKLTPAGAVSWTELYTSAGAATEREARGRVRAGSSVLIVGSSSVG